MSTATLNREATLSSDASAVAELNLMFDCCSLLRCCTHSISGTLQTPQNQGAFGLWRKNVALKYHLSTHILNTTMGAATRTRQRPDRDGNLVTARPVLRNRDDAVELQDTLLLAVATTGGEIVDVTEENSAGLRRELQGCLSDEERRVAKFNKEDATVVASAVHVARATGKPVIIVTDDGGLRTLRHAFAQYRVEIVTQAELYAKLADLPMSDNLRKQLVLDAEKVA